MIRTLVLVPIRDDIGQPFPLERRLLRFGGFTQPADVAGAWRFGNRVYRDVSRQYIVSLESWEQLPRWLTVIRRARQAFRQEALYIEVAGVPEVIGSRR